MNNGVVSFFATEHFDGAVGNDFIHVHVGAGAGTALDAVNNEFFVKHATDDFVACRFDGIGNFRFQPSGFPVGNGGCTFYFCKVFNENGV